MKITSLLYHDVIENGNFQESGFNGVGPDSYKLDLENFTQHIEKVATELEGGDRQLQGFLNSPSESQADIKLITFDDGGVSFLTTIAPLLEKYNLRGVFFISTKYIGTAGFLTIQQVKELKNRGHIIGSHSHSHPKIISNLSYDQLIEEWKTSKKLLEEIIDDQVDTASVPGGYFSESVARSAEECGYKILFTSEPSNDLVVNENCYIVGRYSIKKEDNAEKAEKIIKHHLLFFIKEYVFWNGKKIVKRFLGTYYLKLREKLLK